MRPEGVTAVALGPPGAAPIDSTGAEPVTTRAAPITAGATPIDQQHRMPPLAQMPGAGKPHQAGTDHHDPQI